MMAANSRRRIGNRRFVWTMAMIASKLCSLLRDGACVKD